MARLANIFRHVEALDADGSWVFSARASTLLRRVLPLRRQYILTHYQKLHAVLKKTVNSRGRQRYSGPSVRSRCSRRRRQDEIAAPTRRVDSRGRITRLVQLSSSKRSSSLATASCVSPDAPSLDDRYIDPAPPSLDDRYTNPTPPSLDRRYFIPGPLHLNDPYMALAPSSLDNRYMASGPPPDQEDQDSRHGEENFENDPLGLAMFHRNRAVNTWHKSHKAMETHRSNYRRTFNEHKRGNDPGIPNWSRLWTDGDFDREQLRHAMDLAGQVRKAQHFLDIIVNTCGEFGIEALSWQDQDFPAVESPHYPLSWEQEAIDEAPREAIQRWADGLPENEKELGGSRGVFDPDHNPARYAGDHIIEWPADMDIAVDRDVEPWDSFSCHAINFHETTHRIHRMAALQLPEPPSWTWSEGAHHRDESNNLRLLQSHMC
ncbi:hypothetical protein LTR37_005787 [Vermiconidia calcicola]|uniref:Uncharacterized protein n=1 Tax=Vermiconidia calcicola TaxID=1690605 RepID=A0ACC3NJS3_9PEZI|nr:hypothetical protein LTR37_005787 [Vermiconidia calcicola]